MLHGLTYLTNDVPGEDEILPPEFPSVLPGPFMPSIPGLGPAVDAAGWCIMWIFDTVIDSDGVDALREDKKRRYVEGPTAGYSHADKTIGTSIKEANHA
jgi:hypothetical protein